MLFSQNSATKIIIRKQEEKLHSVMKVNIQIDISTEPVVNVHFCELYPMSVPSILCLMFSSQSKTKRKSMSYDYEKYNI